MNLSDISLVLDTHIWARNTLVLRIF